MFRAGAVSESVYLRSLGGSANNFMDGHRHECVGWSHSDGGENGSGKETSSNSCPKKENSKMWKKVTSFFSSEKEKEREGRVLKKGREGKGKEVECEAKLQCE